MRYLPHEYVCMRRWISILRVDPSFHDNATDRQNFAAQNSAPINAIYYIGMGKWGTPKDIDDPIVRGMVERGI